MYIAALSNPIYDGNFDPPDNEIYDEIGPPNADPFKDTIDTESIHQNFEGDSEDDEVIPNHRYHRRSIYDTNRNGPKAEEEALDSISLQIPFD